MSDSVKRMDLTEFREAGFLQEVNRLFFHPLGLALEWSPAHDGEPAHLGGVWDYRDDPEGMAFDAGIIDPAKAERVEAERARHVAAREALLGAVIQPITKV